MVANITTKLRAVIARYLDGQTPFQAAARELATILRLPGPSGLKATRPHDPHRLLIRKLSVQELLDGLRVVVMDHRGAASEVDTSVLPPGLTPADRARAHALFEEALRLLHQDQRRRQGGGPT